MQRGAAGEGGLTALLMGGGGRCSSPGPAGVLQCDSAGLGWPLNVQTPCAGLPRRLRRGACARAPSGRNGERASRVCEAGLSDLAPRKFPAMERHASRGWQNVVRSNSRVCARYLAPASVHAPCHEECVYREPGCITEPSCKLLGCVTRAAAPEGVFGKRLAPWRIGFGCHTGRVLRRRYSGLRYKQRRSAARCLLRRSYFRGRSPQPKRGYAYFSRNKLQQRQEQGRPPRHTRLGWVSERVDPRMLGRRVLGQKTDTRAHDKLVFCNVDRAARRKDVAGGAFQAATGRDTREIGYTRFHPVTSCVPALHGAITHSLQSMFARK